MDDARADLAARGFTDGPLYDSARPDYAIGAVEHIVSTFSLDATSHVLDLGAGTGIFSRQIAPYVSRVTAVEPSASMRASLSARGPGITVMEGRDVSIPLVAASVDAVVVAQAFHWFDAPRALVEIHRVLSAGGGLALVWNDRDESVEWVAKLTRVLEPIRPPALDSVRDVAPLRASELFSEVSHARFSHVQVLTRDDLFRLILSRSYVAVLDDVSRERLLRDVARVVDSLDEPLSLAYATDVYCALARRVDGGDRSHEDVD
jgi:SAM-dependent methyltransferase